MTDPDVKKVVRRLRRAGYAVSTGGSGHFQVRDAAGRLLMTMAATPSDWRAMRKIRSDARRLGA